MKGLVTHARCDIRNFREIASRLGDTDLVVHTAVVQIPLINENKSLGYEVNIIGTQNICKAVEQNSGVKGLLLTGSWHTVGEKEFRGVIDEEFGFRPDKVEDRARLYALSKISQESIVRFYDEMSDKIYGIIRLGTVLGEGMPEKTAASIFIERGLKGEPITPFKHSMHRPMLYVNVADVCHAFEIFTKKILDNEIQKNGNSLEHIVNIYYPKPITILELAQIVKESIEQNSRGEIQPKIEVVDKNIPPLYSKSDKKKIKVNLRKAKRFLGLQKLRSPKESIAELVKHRMASVYGETLR